MRRVASFVALVALAALAPVGGAAQEATPPPGAEVAGPEACRTAPPSLEEIVALITTPAAGTEAPTGGLPAAGEQRAVASEAEFPSGEPADEATTEAIAAVTGQFVA